MIASWRGIVALAAVALALAVALVVDLSRPPAPPDRRLVHIHIDKVQRLAWGSFVATRAGDQWKAGDVVLDADAIADVLRTLEAATWHRRGGTPGTIHATLDVDQTHIGIGDPLPGSDQTWVVVDGTPLLVDAWVARALAPGELALHVQHPFAAVGRSDHVTVGGTSWFGHPRMVVGGRLADVAAVSALERALADAEVVALGGAHDDGTATQVMLDGVIERAGGSCDAQGTTVAIAGTYGSECIPRASWERILEAARAATAPDLRPVVFVPVTMTIADGTAIDLRAEPAAPVVHALVTPATSLELTGALPEITHVTVAGAHGEQVELRVRPHDLVERMTDGAVLQIAHEDWLALQKPASAWADPTRWSEDPSAVVQIAVDATTYRRGAVLGEWTPAGPLAPKQLEPLAAALAHVQARDAAPAPTAHTLAVTLAPPVGPQTTHGLELGAHCTGRIDAKPVVFEPATCHALEAALR